MAKLSRIPTILELLDGALTQLFVEIATGVVILLRRSYPADTRRTRGDAELDEGAEEDGAHLSTRREECKSSDPGDALEAYKNQGQILFVQHAGEEEVGRRDQGGEKQRAHEA